MNMAKPENTEDYELEPTLDVETSPMMEPSSAFVCELSTNKPKNYWDAQVFASNLHREFEELQAKDDDVGMRRSFYLLTRYYGRTLYILRSAVKTGKKELITATIQNLIALHEPLHHMHETAPETIPFVITLDQETRIKLLDDLIINRLQESTEPLTVIELAKQIDERRSIIRLKPAEIQKNLNQLIETGHVKETDKGYERTIHGYSPLNMDQAALQALLGTEIYRDFQRGGFHGLEDIIQRRTEFLEFFDRFSGCGQDIAKLFTAAALELTESQQLTPEVSTWSHVDLVGSRIPRPYQRLAYSIFRGYNYQGQLIEAPTGSGKTLIGMMVIQDWLKSLSRGQTILVLVPTANYMQQWLRELSYKSIGLQLPPAEVFIGSPGELDSERIRTGVSPAILVMTYTALSQMGSPKGKGGFDTASIERFLQGNDIRYVILDEVHKSVENLKSVSADVTRLLSEWLHDESIQGLIGFSGTATAYRDRFEQLGLKLVYTLPTADLIAYGFVAPFAEFGVPFAYSSREKQVRDLLDEYKKYIREYIDLLDAQKLREMFSKIPIETRVEIGRDLLGMYSGRTNQTQALREQYTNWEKDEKITLNELPLITILQITEGLSDSALSTELEADSTKYDQIITRLLEIREELRNLLLHQGFIDLLQTTEFANSIDQKGLLELPISKKSKSAIRETAKDLLATTIVGLYTRLKGFYYRVGEGRVDVIKSVINAERRIRNVTNIIVFDRGRRINWKEVSTMPGYAGVAGLFSQILGDPSIVPMAVLSSEIYLPFNDEQIPGLINEFIKNDVMFTELGDILYKIITRDIDVEGDRLRNDFDEILKEYIDHLINVRKARRAEFQRKVLNRLRKTIRGKYKKLAKSDILDRLKTSNIHVQNWMDPFFDYALVSNRFTEALKLTLLQASGEPQEYYVVKMASGERKRLMYDLVSRIMDSGKLPINVIIVSTWARTGWNVISPNLLIDATATRNITAWQQLRGRAMRSAPSWNIDSYEGMMALLGSSVMEGNDSIEGLQLDILTDNSENIEYESILSEKTKKMLLEIHEEYTNSVEEKKYRLKRKISRGNLDAFTEEEKIELATELMLTRNKVTHIYELVKAYGSTSQIKFNRDTGLWTRKPSLAEKHVHEYSVNPWTGVYESGESHAPLIYTTDPRNNLPSELETQLANEVSGRDPSIVKGWIQAVTTDE